MDTSKLFRMIKKYLKKNSIFLILLFLINILVIVKYQDFLLTPGTISYKDIAFPQSWGDLVTLLFYSYNQWEKVPNTYFSQIIIYTPILLLSKIDFFVGIRSLFLLFPLISFSLFYFSCYFYIKKHFGNLTIYGIIFSLLLSLFYAINPYSLLIYHNDIGYSIIHAILPIFIIALYCDSRIFKLLLTSILICALLSQPQGIFLSLPFLIVILASFKKDILWVLPIIALLLSFWILPIIHIVLSSSSSQPGYPITPEMIQFQSSNTNLIKSLFLENWPWIDDVIFSNSTSFTSLWKYFFFIPLILSLFISFFPTNLKNTYIKRMKLLSLGLFLLYWALSCGINFPIIGKFYEYIILNFSYGWVIRSPFRFNTWLVYSMLLYSLVVFIDFNRDSKLNHKKLLSVLFCLIMFLAVSPLVNSFFVENATISSFHTNPSTYHQLHNYCLELNETGVVLLLSAANPYAFSYRTVNIHAIPSTYTTFSHTSLRERASILTVEDYIIKNPCKDVREYFSNSPFSVIVVDKNIGNKTVITKTKALESRLTECLGKPVVIGNLSIYHSNVSNKSIFVPTSLQTLATNLLPIDIRSAVIYPEESSIQFLKRLNNFPYDNHNKIDIIPLESEDALKLFIPWWNYPPDFLWDWNMGIIKLDSTCNILDVPFKVKKSDNYDLFIRYFQNEKGGEIGVYLDASLIDTIDTESQINKFTWEKLATVNLSKGRHLLTLRNIDGFNAVNIFALVPEEEHENMGEYEKKAVYNLKDKRIIYVFEAESDLYRDNGIISKNREASNGEVLEIADGKAWQEVEIIKNGTYSLAIRAKGDFQVQIDDEKFEFHNSNLTYWYSPVFELNDGKYNLTLTPLDTPASNFSFEQVSPNIENGIIKKLPEGIISLSNNSYSGKSSLKVTSNVTEGMLWFRTTEVNVTPGERYLAITHIKYENVVASYILLEGYNETSREWIELGQIPSRQDGTSDWKEYHKRLTIPEDVGKIGFGLNAGWIKDPGEGDATTWFDAIRIYPVKDYLDIVWLYSTKNNETLKELFETNETPAEVINYTKINPTKYEVKVNATKPFMLSFAEAYDPLWEARVYKGDKKIEVVKPIPLYSVINGFWVEETGNLEIEIRYKPQDWFELGLLISGMTFIFYIGFLFYDWRRGRGDRWALRIGARLRNAGSVISKGFRERMQGLKKEK